MIKTVFFFRKAIPGYHSIEELFRTLMAYLPDDIAGRVLRMPFISSGFCRRILNILFTPFFSGRVNHITGDVHYIVLFLPRKQTILTIHDLEVIHRNKAWKRFYLLLFWFYIPVRRVRFVTVISEFTKQELLSYVNMDPERIKVIPNCLPGEYTPHPKEFNENCPVILQVGTKQNKNIPNLVKALEGIHCKLIVLGVLEPEQHSLLKNAGIDFEVKCGLPYEEVKKLYASIDLLAFVSTYEGFGLPILEAQATGRPVITSNISSMPEVAGDAAVLVNPFDPDDIRTGIQKIISDKKLRESLVQKGLENVKKYHPKEIAERYAELYREIGR